MTMEVYYKMINTGAGKKLKEILNGLLPGLIPEPVPVSRICSKNVGCISPPEGCKMEKIVP